MQIKLDRASRINELLPCDGERVRPKPPGGTEIGHILELDGRPIILKMGIHLSLLGSAVRKTATESFAEGQKHLGYLFASFERLSAVSDDEKRDLKIQLEEAFVEILRRPLGLSLMEKAQKGITFSTHDIELLFMQIVEMNPRLKPVFVLPSLVDLIAANASQTISNQFQAQFGPVAEASVIIAGSTEQKQVYTGSVFLDGAIPFHTFLLEPFARELVEGELSGEAIERAKAALATSLEQTPLQGLTSAVLMRLIFGESADIGPDNMLLTPLTKNGTAVFNVLNIDLTGFRYPRKDNFRKLNEAERFGWEHLLLERDPERLAELILDGTVFSNRFVKKIRALEVHTNKIFSAIVEVLKPHILATALYEKNVLVAWFSNLDLDKSADTLANATMELNEMLPVERKVDDPDVVRALIKRNAAFITEPIRVARGLIGDSISDMFTFFAPKPTLGSPAFVKEVDTSCRP